MEMTIKLDAEQLKEAAQNAMKNWCGDSCPYYEKAKELSNIEETIYCGTEEYVEFFNHIISTLGLEDVINYRVEVIDGEYEIRIGEEI